MVNNNSLFPWSQTLSIGWQSSTKEEEKERIGVSVSVATERDSETANCGELRQKFEDDKRRVAEMKARRKFKPS